MTIQIHLLRSLREDGQTRFLTLNVEPNLSVASLRAKIKEVQYTYYHMWLIYKGLELWDHKTIADYNITNGSHLMMRFLEEPADPWAPVQPPPELHLPLH